MNVLNLLNHRDCEWQNHEILNIERIVLLCIRFGHVRERSRVEVFENLAIDVLLKTSLTNQSISGIFSRKQKIVQWLLQPVATINTEMVINSMNAGSTVLNVDTASPNDALSDKFSSCFISCQIQIAIWSQAAVLVSSESAGLITIATHCWVFERQCSMTTKGLMDILLGKLVYVYLVNPTAKAAVLTIIILAASASNATSCVIQAQNDESYMWKYEVPILTQCDKSNSYPTLNAFCFKLPENWNEQLDHHNSVKESNKMLNIDWREDITSPDKYSANRDKSVNMRTKLENMLDRNRGLI